MKSALRISAVVLLSMSAFTSGTLVANAKTSTHCVATDDLETNDTYDCKAEAAKDGAPCYCLVNGRKVKGHIEG